MVRNFNKVHLNSNAMIIDAISQNLVSLWKRWFLEGGKLKNLLGGYYPVSVYHAIIHDIQLGNGKYW
jgi:hypothetical protein